MSSLEQMNPAEAEPVQAQPVWIRARSHRAELVHTPARKLQAERRQVQAEPDPIPAEPDENLAEPGPTELARARLTPTVQMQEVQAQAVQAQAVQRTAAAPPPHRPRPGSIRRAAASWRSHCAARTGARAAPSFAAAASRHQAAA